MKDKLIKLLDNAYTPYYHFPVSAIVSMKDGKEFSGVNVENANGTSICAERNAIHQAISNGYKKGDFACLYLMGQKLITPCFACRQVLLEFLKMDTNIVCMSSDGLEKVYTLKDLCPFPFGEDDLNA